LEEDVRNEQENMKRKKRKKERGWGCRGRTEIEEGNS
jgi:hypothetical protein